jgi:glutamyl/glutaminyl-tRNA synthetase
MLEWSGLEWNEGPHSKCSRETQGKSDGPLGPYIQSQRLQMYQEYIKLLLEVSIQGAQLYRNAKPTNASAQLID